MSFFFNKKLSFEPLLGLSHALPFHYIYIYIYIYIIIYIDGRNFGESGVCGDSKGEI